MRAWFLFNGNPGEDPFYTEMLNADVKTNLSNNQNRDHCGPLPLPQTDFIEVATGIHANNKNHLSTDNRSIINQNGITRAPIAPQQQSK